MRIGIDGNLLGLTYHSGMRHYLENLIFNLAKIDKKNEYLIFASKKVKIPKQKNFKLKKNSSNIPVLKRQLIYPFFIKKQNIDVFHYPNETWASVFVRLPNTVVTLHDFASSYAYPSWFSHPKLFLFQSYYNFVRKYILKKCSRIIAVSKTIADEATSLDVPRSKITVIYHGISKDFRKTKKHENGNYFLAFADFSPRKNIIRVLEAFALYLKKTHSKIRLKVIISTPSPRPAIIEKSRELDVLKKVVILENVSQKKLIKLYQNSTCLVWPSLYEGFSLPIVEAFACGCPVITSNYGAMKEVSGNAALVVNPESVNDVVSWMIRIVEDKKVRAELVKKGFERAKKFSWLNTAKQTLKIYEKVYRQTS